MIVFDVENYASDNERADLAELGITAFCKEGAYLVLNAGDNEEEILGRARGCSVPVMLRGEDVKKTAELCRANPDIIFIAGGFFSKSYTPSASAELLKEHQNVFINLSGMFSLGNYYLHTLLEIAPCKRLLFGTAYPYANPAYKKATVLWEMRDVADEVKERIMYKNAARLFGEW